MRIGVTGHQARPGIDWAWIERELRAEIKKLEATTAYSSLAKGSDQVFAQVALDLAIAVIAVIPADNYSKHFQGADRLEYERLLCRCDVVNLLSQGSDEEGFLAAGKYVTDNSDVLFAIWDGHASKGLGGTADIVDYATRKRKRIVHINPISRLIKHKGG
jgi:hypothetical protein